MVKKQPLGHLQIMLLLIPNQTRVFRSKQATERRLHSFDSEVLPSLCRYSSVSDTIPTLCDSMT